ncbi:MAG: FAD-binding oxidoreductase [Candidatus Saccharimonadales bacterium]
MSKIAHYLQEHVLGEVMTSTDMRNYFSTDGGVFTVTPSVVLYPRNENDVRKTARFSWQLAERGRVIPITARGMGTDQAGAAIGSGIMMVFPAHMNKISELDGKSGVVIVDPGINYGRLQQSLHTHGRYLPPYPSSVDYSTIGGAVANNAGGEKSVKYGKTRKYVRSLRVVLANGEVIQTGRINKREVNKKLGLATFEGEIYRALDKLFEEKQDIIGDVDPIKVTKNSAGYDIWDIKNKDGSYDLTPLFVGSQGTLGIVTQVELNTEPFNTQTTLLVGSFDDIKIAETVALELRALADGPSAIEMVDGKLLEFIDKHNPNSLNDVVTKPYHKIIMLVEFDDNNDRQQRRLTKKAQKIFDKYEISYQLERDSQKQAELWKIRRSAASIITHNEGNLKALPVIEDGIVPTDRFQEYLDNIYALFDKYHLKAAVWGHAGDANLHMQPFLDLSEVADRQKVFKLAEEYYQMVIDLGGSTSGEHNDGRLRGPYLKQLYGEEIYQVFERIKLIFDPHGTLNPGVKIGVSVDDIKPLLRHEYTMDHLFDHFSTS